MYGEKGSLRKKLRGGKKALHHWIELQISHLVAIQFGAWLLEKLLAEVRDM